MDFLTGVLADTQKAVVAEVKKLVAEQRIQEEITEELKQNAQAIAAKIQNDSAREPVNFEPVSIEDDDLIEYQLILEYFESCGMKFLPTVFRYECQHPSVFSDRVNLAKALGLRAFDRTPLLVQMIEAKQQAGNLGWD
jgi:hypothetical protein